MAVEDPTAHPPRPHPANRLPRGGVVVIRRGLDLDLVQTHRQMKKPGGEHDPSHKADKPYIRSSAAAFPQSHANATSVANAVAKPTGHASSTRLKTSPPMLITQTESQT